MYTDKSPIRLFAGSLSVGFLICGAVFAADEPESASDEKSKTKTVKIGGVFEAINSVEISPDTEHITSLEIKRIVPHGTKIGEVRTSSRSRPKKSTNRSKRLRPNCVWPS